MHCSTLARPFTTLALLLGLALAAEAHAEAWFTGIGDAPGGEFHSEAIAVSNGGVVVGTGKDAVSYDIDLPGLPAGTQVTQSRYRALRWTREGGLEVFPDEVDGAIDVSTDGSVVLLTANDPDGNRVYLWSGSEGLVDTGIRGRARDLSGDGLTIVGDYASESQTVPTSEAFRWTASGGLEPLGFLLHTNPRSQATGVSADGRVVVGTSRNYELAPGFRWTPEEAMQPLEPFAYVGHSIAGVSGDGLTVIGAAEGDLFAWTPAGGYQIVEDTFLPGVAKQMRDVSYHGMRIVGGNWASPLPAAFLWDPINGMRSLQELLENEYGLDLAGWTLTTAFGISPDGRTIVGQGINPDGNDEGWVAHLDSVWRCGAGGELALLLPILIGWHRSRRRSGVEA